jgi:predicted nucleic acid-binding protein
MASLRKSGKPIPINDVWIAAHGLETGSILVTYDDHFAVIPGLRLWPEIGH